MKIALTENEINDCLKIRDEALDYEQAVRLLEKIIDLDKAAEGSPFDKLIWSIRSAYLIGFRDALEAYNQAVKVQED